jgi:hypothetical protein
MLSAYQAITVAKAMLCNPEIIVAWAARRLGIVPSTLYRGTATRSTGRR